MGLLPCLRHGLRPIPTQKKAKKIQFNSESVKWKSVESNVSFKSVECCFKKEKKKIFPSRRANIIPYLRIGLDCVLYLTELLMAKNFDNIKLEYIAYAYAFRLYNRVSLLRRLCALDIE